MRKLLPQKISACVCKENFQKWRATKGINSASECDQKASFIDTLSGNFRYLFSSESDK